MSYPLPLTRTEAYLAYKAGVIQQSELKPSLAVPRIGIDAWLAYWTGLTKTYPNKGHGKNLFNKNSYNIGNLYINPANVIEAQSANRLIWVECEPNTTYTVQSASSALNRVFAYTKELPTVGTTVYGRTQISAGETSATLTTGPDAKYLVYRVWHASVSTETFQEAIDSLQIEVGAEPSEYEPYTLYPLILQEEEAYIAYLCGVTDTYPEKCLRRVGAYLRYIISARWGRPDHPLNREELYLSLIKTQFIPSGDPSSDIVIDGTAKAPFVDVKMYGDTYQQSYEGKNLAKPLSGGSKNGITVSYNATEDVFVVDGTCTAGNTTINFLGELTFESGTDYTVTTIPISGSVDAYHANTSVQLFTSNYGPNNVVIRPFTGESIQSSTKNFDSDTTLANNAIRAENGDKFTNFKFRVQIEKNSTYSSYEPFVGGKASPNPDYPQPVQTVTGSQTVTVTGKNIFDGQLEIGGWVISTGQTSVHATNNNAYRCVNPIPVEPSSTYSFSVNDSRFDGFRVIFCDSNMTVLSSVVINTTITTPADCAYITFYSSALKTQFPDLSDIKTTQLEKGSDVSAYTPYSKTDYHIDLGDIKLCGLGDDGSGNPLYEDYIYQDMDEWKVHKETANITLDNTADTSHWSKSNSTANNVYINQNIPGLAKESPLAANNLTVYNTSDIYNNNIVGICYNTTGQGLASIRIGVGLSGASTVGLFKSWLEENPVTAYYALATPTDTVITDQNLINQLNALKKGGSEEGTTYIRVSAPDPNLPAKLYVEAAKYV